MDNNSTLPSPPSESKLCTHCETTKPRSAFRMKMRWDRREEKLRPAWASRCGDCESPRPGTNAPQSVGLGERIAKQLGGKPLPMLLVAEPIEEAGRRMRANGTWPAHLPVPIDIRVAHAIEPGGVRRGTAETRDQAAKFQRAEARRQEPAGRSSKNRRR
ncbi:hypothetical protein [Flindersiella endophytica]